MKTVVISGKRNRDMIEKVETPVREEVSRYKFEVKDFDHNQQISIVNKLYLDNDLEYKKDMTAVINKKLQGYRSQDKQKKLWNDKQFITIDETLEALVASKLRCHYCSNEIFLLYEKVGEKRQWTLDRIDNQLGHFRNNIVISCLECNIQRKDMSKDKFKFSKNLKIVRSE